MHRDLGKRDRTQASDKNTGNNTHCITQHDLGKRDHGETLDSTAVSLGTGHISKPTEGKGQEFYTVLTPQFFTANMFTDTTHQTTRRLLSINQSINQSICIAPFHNWAYGVVSM